MSTLEEIEAKRAAMRAAREEARKCQKALDLEAIMALEEEHGEDRIVVIESEVHVKGVPVLVAMRTPSRIEFKRFQDMSKKQRDGKSGDPIGAMNTLGESCLLYPPKEQYEQLLEASPGLHIVAATAAVQKVGGSLEAESKS